MYTKKLDRRRQIGHTKIDKTIGYIPLDTNIFDIHNYKNE